MTDIIAESVSIANPMALIPASQKVDFPHQRKREFNITADQTEPSAGWTHNNTISFTLSSDVGLLDMKHLVFKAKYRQQVIREAGLCYGLKYYDAIDITGDDPVNFDSNDIEADDYPRVLSYFDLEYGVLSLFQTLTLKINDKILWKTEELDRIRKIIHVQTAVEEMPTEFTKFTQGGLANLSGTNFDFGDNETWFDILMSFDSLLDEFPLLPLYKVVGDIKIELRLNTATRAFKPSLTRGKMEYTIEPYLDEHTAAEPLIRDCSIAWTNIDLAFFIKKPTLMFYGLELMDDSAKDMDDLNSHILMPTITYRDFTKSTSFMEVNLGLKIPSIRYVGHMLIDRKAETNYVPLNTIFRLAKYELIHQIIDAGDDVGIRNVVFTPARAVSDGINAYSMVGGITLPLKEAYADIGNLKYPSDKRYEGNFEMYLQKILEFNGYTFNNMLSSKPLVTYISKNGNWGYPINASGLETVLPEAGVVSVFKHSRDPGIEEGEYERDDKPLNYWVTERFTQPVIEHNLVENTNLWSDTEYLRQKQGQALYWWNFSKMVQKGKAITGDLNTQFNSAKFYYVCYGGITDGDDGGDMDLKWLQLVFQDGKLQLNARNGNFSLFV